MRLRSSGHVFLLCALTALICLPSLGLRDLWNPDEPRYAEVARQMLVLDEYFVPHLNGEIYSEKPPLFFWLSALGQTAGLGFNAGRVVTGLAAAGTLLLTWALARRFLTARAALLAAVALGTTELFQMLGRSGILDILLTFFVTLAVYGWYRGGRAIVLFYAGMGLAVLTKGPVGVAVACFAAVAFAITHRGTESRGRPWHLLWGPPITLAIVAAWLWPACVRGGPEYTDAILFKQNVGRMAGSWSHARPFWYYVPYLAGTFFPWILFVPSAFVRGWRGGDRFLKALVLWTAVGFLFFSAVSGKRERYLMPLFPPLAILVGAWLDGRGDISAHRWLRVAARLPHFVFFGVGIALFLLAVGGRQLVRLLGEDSEVAVELGGLTTVPGILGAFALAVAVALLARRGLRAGRAGQLPRAAGYLALEVVIVFAAGWDLLLVPRINEFKSPREVALALNEWQEEREVAAYPAHFSGAYNLYSRRDRIEVLETPDEVALYLAGPGRRLVLTSRESYERKPRDGGLSLEDTLAHTRPVTWLGRVGHRQMGFITNYPPPR